MARKSRPVAHPDPDFVPKRRRSLVVVAGVGIMGLAIAFSSLSPLLSLFDSPAPQAAAPASPSDEGLKALEAAAKANPKDAATLIALGNAQFDSGNFPRAAETYAQALALTPKNPDVRVDMGTALFYQGKAKEAIEAYHQALGDAPSHLNAHMNLGIVYRSAGNPAEAKAHWSKALTLTQDPEVQERLKVLLSSVGG